MKKNEESQVLTGSGFQDTVVSATEAHAERLHSAVRESLRHSLVGEPRLETQSVTETVYNEMALAPLQKKEPIALLRSNMETLENMIQRWSFVMKENRYLLKADSEDFN